jgi:carbon-monoxide dehydrogenase large subunit
VTDIGGWNSPFGSAQLASVVFTGPYKVPDASVTREVVLTNKTLSVLTAATASQRSTSLLRCWLTGWHARWAETRSTCGCRICCSLRTSLDYPSGAVCDSGDYPRSLRMAAEAVSYEAHRMTSRLPRADGRIVGIDSRHSSNELATPVPAFLLNVGRSSARMKA